MSVFTFDQLSAVAKANALESNREILVEFDNYWCEYTLERFKEELEEIGFNDVEISFSGFWSQGDGASFTSHWINVEKFLRSQKVFAKYRRFVPNFGDNAIDYQLKIDRNDHRYYHENTVYVNDYYYHVTTDKQADMIAEISGILIEFVKEKSREIYKTLEADYEYNRTDEAIADFFTANEWEFDEYGEKI